MIARVYEIRHRNSGKVYIGITRQAVSARIRHHINRLERGNHTNTYLQAAWNKHGRESFVVSHLFSCGCEKAGEWERRLIAYHKNKQGVYNLTTGGEEMVAFTNDVLERMSYSKKGEKHPRASLTKDDILLLYRMASLGRANKDIAKHFKVSATTIGDIIKGRTWPHIYTKEIADRIAIGRLVRATLDAQLRKEEKRIRQEEKKRVLKARAKPPSRWGECHPRVTLTEQDIRDIRYRASMGESGHSIARQYGKTPSYINKVIRKERWKHL